MPFELDEEQQLIRRTAREFASSALAPSAAAMDREARFPSEAQRGLADLGFWGLLAARDAGGAGVGLVGFTVALEELARRSGSVAVVVLAHNLAAASAPGALAERLAAGAVLGTAQLGRGPLAGALRGAGAREGAARLFPLAGRAGPALLWEEAGPALLPPGEPAAAWAREPTLGLRGAELGQVVLRGARPEPAAADPSVPLAVGLAAVAAGLGQASVEEGARFARDRVQFGRPIGAFEGVRARLAEMASGIDAGRALTLQAAALADRGEPAARAAAEAKVVATEAASQATRLCVKLHGGAGFLKDFPAERLHRDARMLPLLGGDTAAHRDAVGRALLG